MAMTTKEKLLSDIEEFLKRQGMYPTQFGRLVANDTALVSRLRAGGSVRIDTAEKLQRFMATYQPPKPSGRRGNGEARAA